MHFPIYWIFQTHFESQVLKVSIKSIRTSTYSQLWLKSKWYASKVTCDRVYLQGIETGPLRGLLSQLKHDLGMTLTQWVRRRELSYTSVTLIHQTFEFQAQQICGYFISLDLDYTHSWSSKTKSDIKWSNSNNFFKVHTIARLLCWMNEKYVHIQWLPLSNEPSCFGTSKLWPFWCKDIRYSSTIQLFLNWMPIFDWCMTTTVSKMTFSEVN